MPNFTFCEGRKQAMTKFILFMNLDMVDRNSAPEEFACIWQSKWVGIITIETEKMWVHSSCDVFVVVSCRGILNSLIFTKAWSMQAWIPVVSSSLYFWKSVFSFRVDSILKWRVYIKQKVSWLHAFLWCMSQTSRDRDNSRRVRTHEKNSGETVRRLGTMIQSIFLCPIRSQHSLDRLEMVRWESVPRGFSAVLENLRRAFPPGPTDRPRRTNKKHSFSRLQRVVCFLTFPDVRGPKRKSLRPLVQN